MKIDGKEIAKEVFKSLKDKIKKLKESNVTPHLVVILIGNDPASISYVNQKEIKGKRIGAKITLYQYPNSVTTKTLLDRFNDLNHLSNVHGIIAQRPLPQHLDSKQISLAIDPKKDVDGFHPNSKFQPPISLAVLRILEETFSFTRSHLARLQGETLINWLKSKSIVVIGKGETGGRPIIQLFKQKMEIEPQVIDSKTENPEQFTKKADIIISAVGKPDIVKPEMLKREVILIGIGLSKGTDGKLHGNYDEEKVKNIASFYTPNPGGVGPLNVAMLLENLVKAAENPN
jgi:methylenetetrahydrofolate dehydrogenase (NADP+)/methenyltetrahydrofolate cyclohydrolase